ncbi:hypothetical protein [uncultured Chitinophaga sp.]|uniref:hypothetical protein n=1 Tax=uncultured Chitinophaga sp. TaxID=339340 RepID=UPI0025E9203D|nr:hypothetical protein [uncultured Chitinophaga sp.]
MPGFNDIIQQLEAARGTQAAEQKGFVQSREALNKIRKQREQLERKVNANSEEYQSQLKKLKAQEEKAIAEFNQRKGTLADAKKISSGVYSEFFKLSDPRQQLSNFSDRTPVMLFPVRIETRFKKNAVAGAATDELWVRIFPDDALIDSFEELLSETELKNTILYWKQHWAAGGDENLERGAWRALAGNHGSGRASYLLEQYKPLNAADAPLKAKAEDVILVIGGANVPTAPEQTMLATYWEKIWRVAGDAVQEQAAWDQLVLDAGGEPAATTLRDSYTPFNLDVVPAAPFTKPDAAFTLAFLQLPDPEGIITKAQSWSQAPLVDMLPERFVVTGYDQNNAVAFQELGRHIPSPLYVAPDPGLSEEEQFSKDANGDIVMPEELQWMVDFDTAIQNGLGLKINITAEQARSGFKRIVVLGVRLSADAFKGRHMLETLFDHHRRSRKGIAILPQGAATNNTESGEALHVNIDDTDESFALLKKGKLFEPETDWILKKDGQWLAESLGIGMDAVNKISNADQSDTAEARMMNVALWPATMGYMMESMMQPVFSDDDIRNTREFFNQFVSGRGRIPAIKIGRQPYGILPVTDFSKIGWLRGRTEPGLAAAAVNNGSPYINRLYNILKETDKVWDVLVNSVSYIGKPGADGQQVLLNALGLNAASVDYFQRTAESKQDIFNRYNMLGIAGPFVAALVSGLYVKSGMDLLKKFGYANEAVPEMLDKFFLKSANKLHGPLIDDRPLSEKELIRKYTTDDKNYIEWLISAVNTSHDTLRKQAGFKDNKIPNALLYLLMHHALDLSYVEVSLRLYEKAQLLNSNQVRAAKIEPAFLHIAEKAPQSESRWSYLYSKQASITGNAAELVGDYIPKIIKTEVASQYMKEQLEAMERLKDLPTARLERIFAEHVDCCSYRLDAWKGAFLEYQLQQLRQQQGPNDEGGNTGTYIGAFGWVENVKSENKVLTPVQLDDPELNKMFIENQSIPLMRDSTNGGFITAPSLDHAVTAAILRNGYTGNKNPASLRVNLSSERVRKALAVVEGVRNGQSMGALLGYYFERGLHEGYPGVELDFFIYQLRKAFPLVVNRIKETQVGEAAGNEVEVIEARNVVDGLSLIDHVAKNGINTYPFGKTGLPALENAAQSTAITKELEKIKDINDAVADLAISESVYQAVLANYDRSNATLETYSSGNFPPIPDVVQTPRRGINLTHRMGLHFKPGLVAAAGATARAKAEPAVNDWLETRVPAMADIICHVSYPGQVNEMVTAAQLGLLPIDLLFMINTESEQALKEIDDRLLKFVMDKGGMRPDAKIEINYMLQVPGKYSLFELAPLFNSLRAILLRSRPLSPNDVTIAIEAKDKEDGVVFVDRNVTRLQATHAGLKTLLDNDLTNFINSIAPLVADTTANRNAIIASLNTAFIQPVLPILFNLGQTGLTEAGYGFVYTRQKEIFLSLINKVAELTVKWDGKLADFDAQIIAYAALPGATTDAERIQFLQTAELHISTLVREVLPALPADYLNILNTVVRPAFVAKLDDLKTVAATAAASLPALLTEVRGKLPVTDFDAEPFDISGIENQFVVFATEIDATAKALASSLTKRLDKALGLLGQVPGVTDGKKQAKLVTDAAAQLFHQDFKIIPEFGVTADSGAEWENSFAEKAQLLSYLQTPDAGGLIKSEFPEDDWLYGLARVREKLHHWENIVLLGEAMGATTPELHPVQLPYQAGDSWLALDYPATYTIDSDRLLYTAHYSTAFSKSDRQCGLLIDEWTEIVPATEETAGLTFHYDRPNAEPPQAILLALPTSYTGSWSWDDLLNTVNVTLESAKKRAVEPAQVDTTAYARFLPGIVSSMTVHPITVSLNLAFNNKIHEVLLNSGQ